MEDKSIEPLSTWDTVLTADCLEFCPHENYRNILAVGTYQLDSEASEQIRVGKLYLFKIENKALILLHELDTSGILDIKWCPHTLNHEIVLAIVTALGKLQLYLLNERGNKLILKSTVKISDKLCLYLDFNSRIKQTEDPIIAISDSNGTISLCSLNSDAKIVHQRNAHQFEAWVASFNYWNASIYYTGGDDAMFKGFDLRCDAPLFSNARHTAGVTSIETCPYKENLLITGSYDEILRVWDCRKMKMPISSQMIGGGLWRLKWNPLGAPLVLASCMHEGFKVLNLADESKVEIIYKYTFHKSLAYGGDWAWEKSGGESMVASVSFYDHLLSLWQFS